jgi:membrane-associated phospholipid phosphatase
VRRYALIDWATQGYTALVAVLVGCFHNGSTPGWPWLVTGHLALLGLVHGLIVGEGRWRVAEKGWSFVRHYYPIPLYGLFYRETGSLNQLFQTGYLDGHFFRLEAWLWGSQPSLWLMEAWPHRWVAEILYASYFSYYLMIAGVGLALFLRDRAQFLHYITVVSLVFYACFVVFIFLPVVGPYVAYEPGNGGLAGLAGALPGWPERVQQAWFYQLMAFVYQHFEAPGGAFPSSHVAVALTTVYFTGLYLRPLRWGHRAAVLLLCIATVYGRYHYVVDVVAGVVTALVVVPLGNRLYGRYGRGQ